MSYRDDQLWDYLNDEGEDVRDFYEDADYRYEQWRDEQLEEEDEDY